MVELEAPPTPEAPAPAVEDTAPTQQHAFNPPSPAPVTIPVRDETELVEDEMQTLALSPGASAPPQSAFAPADLRDGPSVIQPPDTAVTMNSEIQPEEEDTRGEDAQDFDDGDSYGSGAYGDDLGDDDVLDKLGEWGEHLTKLTNEGLKHVKRTGANIARSDYAAKAIEAAKGVGKELAELGSHIAGDDLTPEKDRLAQANATDANTTGAETAEASGQSNETEPASPGAGGGLWGAFSGFAKKAADAIETAASKAADAIEKPADETPGKGGLHKLASRSTELVTGFASKLEAGAFELLGAHPALSGAGDDAAAEIEAALDELGLRERMDAMEAAADEGMAACESIRSALVSDEDRAAFDDVVFVAREILDLDDGTPTAPRAATGVPTPTEIEEVVHPLVKEASSLREGGVDEMLEIASEVASAMEKRAADAVAAVRGAEGADANVSAATRLRLLDEADELVGEMRGECARRVASFVLVIVSHLQKAQQRLNDAEPSGGSVAARAGDVRSAIDGAVNELVGYADDAAEAMRASTADVDGVLGGEGGIVGSGGIFGGSRGG